MSKCLGRNTPLGRQENVCYLYCRTWLSCNTYIHADNLHYISWQWCVPVCVDISYKASPVGSHSDRKIINLQAKPPWHSLTLCFFSALTSIRFKMEALLILLLAKLSATNTLTTSLYTTSCRETYLLLLRYAAAVWYCYYIYCYYNYYTIVTIGFYY